MKYIKIICIILVIIFLLYNVWWILFRFIPQKSDIIITQAQLKSNINAIARKHSNLYANCEIWDESNKLRFKKDNLQIINNMDEKQRIISIGNSDSPFKDASPKEVYGIFESWLFVRNKKLPYEIILICWSYTSGGIDNTNSQTTIIKKTEFEELYKNTDIIGLNHEQSAKVLADKWIKQTGYVKK